MIAPTLSARGRSARRSFARDEEIVDEFLRTYDAAQPPEQAALSVDQVLEELAPYIRPTDRAKAERALRAAASR